jgi:hypothetical protein
MRYPAALPPDPGGKDADLQASAGYSAEGVEDVVVRKRQLTVGLELAIHLVPEPLLNPHEGEPGTQLAATQPNVRPVLVLSTLT